MAIGRIPEPGTGIPESIIAAKGDLIVGTANDAPGILSVGTNGHTLVADSVETTGLKWVAPAAGGALTFIKSETIGTAVSSVTVTSAFSSTYDNYLVTINGGASSTGSFLKLTLGATTANYYYAVNGTDYLGVTANSGGNNLAYIFAGTANTSGLMGQINIYSPHLADETVFTLMNPSILTSGVGYAGGGFLNNTTSYTAFTLTTNTGTITGGTIRVYGYQNS